MLKNKSQKEVSVEDFLNNESKAIIEISDDLPINPDAKLIDFAKIKVSAINPKIKREVAQTIRRIRNNLADLKKTISEPIYKFDDPSRTDHD